MLRTNTQCALLLLRPESWVQERGVDVVEWMAHDEPRDPNNTPAALHGLVLPGHLPRGTVTPLN